jgi:hypothetical protein
MIVPAAVVACDCDEPVIVGAIDAYERSLREGRDPVEGFWGIYLDWIPSPGISRRYRMAVVQNTYGVYPEADYVGVATCDSPGCVKGEVKLLLRRTDAEGEFEATLLVTDVDGAKGRAFLIDNDEGREDSVLDLRGVTYQGHVMAKWMLRIIGG